jgi:hypothetical protein
VATDVPGATAAAATAPRRAWQSTQKLTWTCWPGISLGHLSSVFLRTSAMVEDGQSRECLQWVESGHEGTSRVRDCSGQMPLYFFDTRDNDIFIEDDEGSKCQIWRRSKLSPLWR